MGCTRPWRDTISSTRTGHRGRDSRCNWSMDQRIPVYVRARVARPRQGKMNFDFIYRGETKEIDDDIRASTSGSFIQLSNGFTHYESSGPSLTPFPLLMGEGLEMR